jgi:PqqD family protein of HPr-rel-A system
VSGNTHVLNSTAAEVLKALERQAATSFELSNQLACGFDFGFDTELCQNVEALIVQLDEMGLIEPVC